MPFREAIKAVERRILGNQGAAKGHGRRRDHPVERVPVAPLHRPGKKGDLGRVGRDLGPLCAPERQKLVDDGIKLGPFPKAMLLRDLVEGVVCGRGRNPTLRLWPTIFSGKIDVFPGDRRSRLISSMTSVAPA